jgi:hypothetical protein
MGFFKSLQNIVKKANDATNKVMKVVDPIGGRLKEYTEEKSQAKVNSILGGLFGAPKPSNSYDDLGGTTTQAVSDESMQATKDKKNIKDKQRRQGFSGGSTLLTTTEDESQQLNKNTLLGM